VEIATVKRDFQAIIFAYRIVHDLNSWVFGRERPLEDDERYGAARAMEDAKASELAEIAHYIEINRDGTV
jgi:hypothetical protein